MRELPKLPEVELWGGPDTLVGKRLGESIGYSFVYTAHPSPKGERFFIASDPNSNHSRLIGDNQEEIIPALFGPGFEKIKDLYIDVNVDGKLDPWVVRRLSIETNLYGRYAPEYYGVYFKFTDKPFQIVWLWQQTEDWQHKLKEVLKILKVNENCLIGLGTEIIGFASDFDEKHTSSEKEKEHLRLLARYHIATGEEKETLKRILFGSQNGFKYPDVSKMSPKEVEEYSWKVGHYKKKGRETDPYFLKYGESILNFREWFNDLARG